jgi:hypothetical protein
MSEELKDSRADCIDPLIKFELENALTQRNFEIEHFWKRGWFFGLLLLGIATVYFQYTRKDNEYHIYIALLGLLVSFFQGLMNRGSKYWQERWENKTKNLETLLKVDITKTKRYGNFERYYLDAGTLAKGENIFTRASRYSVSKLTFLIWDLITFFWLFLWIGS